jgi:hypothetical protein
MRLLSFRIGMGNQGAGFAQPKAPLPKQALTLTHPQADWEALLDPGTQRFPIPQRAAQAQVARGLAEHSVHLRQLCLVQTPGTPRALPFGQPGQTSFLKPSNPIFHRPRSISQQPTDLRTGHALGHQQHPVESVIIAGFFRTANLVLQPQNDCLGISNLEWSHAYMKPQIFMMRNYL